MASIRKQTQTGALFVDFRYKGQRCREYTALLLGRSEVNHQYRTPRLQKLLHGPFLHRDAHR